MGYAALSVETLKNGILRFTNKPQSEVVRVPLEFSRGHFTVKTVESKRELWQVMSLRYEVFHREYKNRKFPFGIDRDRFDQFADHLVIIDDRYQKVVGTYRLIRSDQLEMFYSGSEFEISEFLALPGEKVELSRACIQKDYRNGTVISLLWRGIIEYLQKSNARWLFGMASVKSMETEVLAQIYRGLLDMGAVDQSIGIHALEKHRITGFLDQIPERVSEENKPEIPALLRSYLRAGATVLGDPAIDESFNCADLFVVFDSFKVATAYGKKFQLN